MAKQKELQRGLLREPLAGVVGGGSTAPRFGKPCARGTSLGMWPGSGPTRNTRRRHYRCSVPGLAGFAGQALCGARSLISCQEAVGCWLLAFGCQLPTETLTRAARVGKRTGRGVRGLHLLLILRAVEAAAQAAEGGARVLSRALHFLKHRQPFGARAPRVDGYELRVFGHARVEEVARLEAARGEDLVAREERLRRFALRFGDKDVAVAALRLVAHALEDDGAELLRLPDDGVARKAEGHLVGLELDGRRAAHGRVAADGRETRGLASALRRSARARYDERADAHAEGSGFTHGGG